MKRAQARPPRCGTEKPRVPVFLMKPWGQAMVRWMTGVGACRARRWRTSFRSLVMVSSWSAAFLSILSTAVPARRWATSSARPSLLKACTIVSAERGDAGGSGEETRYSTSASTSISTSSRISSTLVASPGTAPGLCGGRIGSGMGEAQGDSQDAAWEISDMLK